MVTGAALATTNRLPVLLLPSDQFATRIPDPVLQQLEDPTSLDVSVNDAFRPVSRFFDRINRPEQLIPSLLAAMRVLTDPAETGAVTIAMPQDVQAEAFDWPVELFRKRVWHVRRPVPEPAALERAAALIRAAKRPLIIAGGGTIYSGASQELRDLATATGIPVADTQAGKGAINFDHPCAVGGVGSTGCSSANHLADKADLIIGVGTRYSDFTTASKTQFKNPEVRFVNINVTPFDAAKESAEMVVADAREALAALAGALEGHRVDEAYSAEIAAEKKAWLEATERCYHLGHGPLPAQTEVFGALNELMGSEDVVINAAGSMPGDLQALWQARTPVQYHVEYAFSCYSAEIAAQREAWLEATERCYHLGHGPLPAQTEVFGALNELMGPEDVVINAAGSMPGDLQALWQARSPLQYHVEYAFSCMGYEIPAAMGVKLARPEAEVVSIVGDGTYQMLPMELATVVQEGIKVIYVLLQNHGFASIGSLSESRGSQRFGTKYRQRGEGSHLADEERIAGVDIAANARSWGLEVLEARTIEEFKEAYRAAAASERATMIHIETDLYGPNPPGSSWWDVPVSGVSELESTQRAYEDYVRDRWNPPSAPMRTTCATGPPSATTCRPRPLLRTAPRPPA